MAAAAALRSVARKMARAPPARPLLARGGAGFGQVGSLPRLTSNDASAVIGSRSLSSNIAHALHKSFSSPITSDFWVGLRKFRAAVAYVTVFNSFIYIYCYADPLEKALRAQVEELLRERSDLKDAIHAIRNDYEHMNVQVENMIAYASKVESMLCTGHEKEPEIKNLLAEINEITIALKSSRNGSSRDK